MEHFIFIKYISSMIKGFEPDLSITSQNFSVRLSIISFSFSFGQPPRFSFRLLCIHTTNNSNGVKVLFREIFFTFLSFCPLSLLQTRSNNIMPPKHYEDLLLLSDSDSGDESVPTLLKPGRCVRAADVLKQPNLVLSSDSVENESLVSHFNSSSLRASDMLRKLDGITGTLPTLAACKSSLLTSFPMMLRQTSQLVDSLNKGDDKADHMVAEIQSKFALDCMDQYLENIEKSISLTEREALDYPLDRIVRSLQPDEEEAPYSCSVSTGVTSRLVFDVGVGLPAVTELEKGPKCPLPLIAHVEPIVELTGDDLLSGSISSSQVRPHTVEIESLSFCDQHFPTSSERTGEARIQVRVSPGRQVQGKKEWKGGKHGEVCMKPLSIHQARVYQLNAYPPKPASTVDVFTSQEAFGTNALTIRLVMKTFKTEHGDAPRLQVELVLPLS